MQKMKSQPALAHLQSRSKPNPRSQSFAKELISLTPRNSIL